jgi:hypothetical protein
MSEQHAKFLQRLKGSSKAVWAVAMHQHARGRMVEVPPLQYAPTAADHELFADDGDLFVIYRRPENPEVRQRLDVKHLRVNFTSAEDFPFPELFISNVASVDRANGSTVAYFIVSNDCEYAAIVPRTTRDKWYVTEKVARNTGNVERNYTCALGVPTFVKLEVL